MSLFNQNNQTEQTDDYQDLRKKREDHAIEIRKQMRNEKFTKRKLNDQPQIEAQILAQTPIGVPMPDSLKGHIEQFQKQNFNLQDHFPTVVQALFSADLLQQHFGVIGLRKILSVEEGPPIQQAIDAAVIPRLIEFIKQDAYITLQLEGAWALTNIASGTTYQTQALIDKGAIPLFCRMLSSPYVEVAEQAIWALGNIAGDCALYRDMILKCGGLDPLIAVLHKTTNKTTIKHGTWAVSNLCRGRPLPKFEFVKNSIPVLGKVIQESTDTEVLTDAAWALSYLSDGDDNRIDMVIKAGVIAPMVQLLKHPQLSIVIPSLRTLGNIITGNESQTNAVLDQGALQFFFFLLNHEKKAVRREACWTLSNITAGTSDQIEKILCQPQYIEKLIQIVQTDQEEIRREAAWVISNSTSSGTPDQIKRLCDMGVLEMFVEVLSSDDAKCVNVVLEALNNVLNVEKKYPEYGYKNKLEQLGGVAKIEKLQLHENEDVYSKALKLLESHFEIDDLF